MFMFSCNALAEENIFVTLNGKQIEFDVPPQTVNDRTMVPMRKIFEELGAKVEWIEDTQMILASKDAKFVLMQIGKPAMIIKDFKIGSEERIELDSEPFITDGRTLVPVRAVSEAFNMQVDWDGAKKEVLINSAN
mgnify:FL=1